MKVMIEIILKNKVMIVIKNYLKNLNNYINQIK